MVPKHPSIHGISNSLVLVSSVQVSGPVQNTWQALVAVDGYAQVVWLVVHGYEGMCHGELLLHDMELGMHDVPYPLEKIKQDDQQGPPQVLSLPTWAWSVGCHGRVWVGWDMEAQGSDDSGHSHSI